MIFEEIREVICEQLEVEPEKVTLETTFEELGADSLDLFQVVIEIEDKYGIQLENAERIKTVKDAVDYVTEVTNNILKALIGFRKFNKIPDFTLYFFEVLGRQSDER